MQGFSRGWWWVACLAALMGSPGVAAAVELSGGAISGAPGTRVEVAVSLAAEGAMVLGTENRIEFGRDVFIPARGDGQPDCAVEPAINKGATAFRFIPLGCDPAATCTGVRVFVLALDNLDPIADGAVLYRCAVTIAADAAAGDYELSLTGVAASAANGVLLPTTGTPAQVTVTASPVGRVVVGSTTGPAGAQRAVDVALVDLAAGVALAGVQNDLAFPDVGVVPAAPGGAPACAVNPAIEKEATAFAFLPDGCTPATDCTGVRAFVVSLSNTAAIADGVTLYTCELRFDADAVPGTYALPASNALASTPDGTVLPLASTAGSLTVESPPPTCAGDCDANGTVTINELLLGVNVIVGIAAPEVCPALDRNGNGVVGIDELVQAVNVALGGCSG